MGKWVLFTTIGRNTDRYKISEGRFCTTYLMCTTYDSAISLPETDPIDLHLSYNSPYCTCGYSILKVI